MEVDESGSEESSRSSSRASSISKFGRNSPLVLNKPNAGGKSVGLDEFAVPYPPSGPSIAHPSKLMLSSARRSSSGIFISNMFSSRFRHLQKLHSDAFLGLNSISYPGLPTGTLFRSSLPATPVSTPIHREPFHQFTEQAIKERLCKTPSPRKNRGFSPHSSRPSSRFQSNLDHMSDNDSTCSDQQPMDTTSPIPPPSSQADEVLSETANVDSTQAVASSSSTDRQSANTKRLFVKNLGYNNVVRIEEMSKFYKKFFQKFGSVEHFHVVEDHIKMISRGFGFVTFRDLESAQKALSAPPQELTVDLTELLGQGVFKPKRTLQVYPAQEKLMNRVRADVQNKKQAKERENVEREELVQRIFSGEIKRQAIVYEEKDISECPIRMLGDDLLSFIFTYLKDLRDCINCERVCRRWKNVMDRVWFTRTRLVLAETFYSLDAPLLNKQNLFMVLRKCPSLRYLNLEKVSCHLDESTPQIIGECCPLLEELVFRDANFTKISLKYLAQRCRHLKSITLDHSNNLTEKNLWQFLKEACSIRILSICANTQITGKCFYLLQNVTEIDTRWCSKLAAECIPKLAQKNRHSLKTLKVGPIKSATLKEISNHFNNLSNLLLIYEDWEANTAFQPFDHIQKLKNLKEISISGSITHFDDQTFLHFLKSCRKLEKIQFEFSSSITDQSVMKIPAYCENLIRLSIPNTYSVTDESLFSLSSLKLEHLEIRSSKATDKGVQKILENCPKLVLLNVNDCIAITTITLERAFDLIKAKKLNRDLVIYYNSYRLRPGLFADKSNFSQWDLRDDDYALDDYDDDSLEDDEYIRDSDFDEEEELT